MIYLAQTDTTAGFLSKDLKALNKLKKRRLNKPCLIATTKFYELKKLTRIPSKFKNLVRKSKKTTFLYANKKAIRVIKDCHHENFLKQYDWLYSTSANEHGKKFDENWARKNANEIIDEVFFETSASKIFKLRGSKKNKLR
ncbi:Sua5 YciO YrdC YwlC family protein [Campylobacter sp.]|uniref:Sua5 YciO YrdC YwlC family protein n=1 Tax=Campylobacter sp. TaxID=205 RepID=UPI0025BEBDB9|nr:Sua5 YciO YrdC YwlC family protein [Campylobacter sp.]